jgi:hypothetical protein
MAYALCIIVSATMIWYLLLSIFAPFEPCTEKTLEYVYLLVFCLIICIFQDQAFHTVIPGENRILRDLFFDFQEPGSGWFRVAVSELRCARLYSTESPRGFLIESTNQREDLNHHRSSRRENANNIGLTLQYYYYKIRQQYLSCRNEKTNPHR